MAVFGYRNNIKPLMDLFVSFLLLAVLWPLLLVLFLTLYLLNGYPVIFRQKRIGLNNEPFSLYKFRTLTLEQRTHLTFSAKDYVTLGRWLRRTGLDELPQLVNVLKGDMSLVGPRPLPVEYHHQIIDHSRKLVKPGITGIVQISGGNHIPWKTRFRMDALYCQNLSFWNDVYICMRTIKVVFTKKLVEGSTLLNTK